VLTYTALSASTFYYRRSQGILGRKPSTHTLKDQQWIPNHQVVSYISELTQSDFIAYGYYKMTQLLRQQGYWIDDKKVYRLMKEARLTYPYAIRTKGKRQFREFRKVENPLPLAYLQMDVKYIYLHRERRHVYLLSVLDVASRAVVGWLLKYSITKHDVIALWRKLHPILNHQVKVTLRTDNGSQFLAHDVRDYLRYTGIEHEFSFVATPQDNGHIESYHNILEREALQRNFYESFTALKEGIQGFVNFYNQTRLHGSLRYTSPNQWLIQHLSHEHLHKIQSYNDSIHLETQIHSNSFRKCNYGFGINCISINQLNSLSLF
jgi:transposase InsO family protein